MIINCQNTDSDRIYHLLVQTVVPRPIAWILSDNGNASFNLAPFSFFNAITSNPPIIMVSAGWKDETTKKDTWINIEERNHFVVHIPSESEVHDVSGSSAAMPFGVSEATTLKMDLEEMDGWSLPRLKKPKVAFYCVKHKIIEVGNDPQALILGEIKNIWIDDTILTDKNGRWTIDYAGLNPIARLGGPSYSVLGKIFTIKRPDS
jgi:flavin reductase (DIM6/NTAB) family NADH-FMN oxidoreductase RutF